MPRVLRWTLPALMLAVAGLAVTRPAAAQNYPMLDKLADKIVAKYQTSSCQQLAAEKGQPKTGQKQQVEERLLKMLHDDPAARQEFLNRVAAPIANKLFECGFIP
jgi:ABC-type Fe2+-enterobactin transport system substrate-binding protein